MCLLAYLSDLTLLYSVLKTHALSFEFDNIQVASLDHAMWFHRPFRVDEWLLYDTVSPSASGARGLGTGQFSTADGRMLATVVQEGLVWSDRRPGRRPPRPRRRPSRPQGM